MRNNSIDDATSCAWRMCRAEDAQPIANERRLFEFFKRERERKNFVQHIMSRNACVPKSEKLQFKEIVGVSIVSFELPQSERTTRTLLIVIVLMKMADGGCDGAEDDDDDGKVLATQKSFFTQRFERFSTNNVFFFFS